MFGKCKALIGVVHLPPLPGSFFYKKRPFPYPRGKKMDIEDIVEYAVKEARKYENAGFDAVIIENYGDKPYKHRVSVGETAAITRVALEVKKSISLPIGINLLRNSPYESLYAAHIVGASFIRVNSLCETRLSTEGIIEPAVRDAARAIQELDLYDEILNGKLSILADVNVKHSYSLLPNVEADVLISDCLKRSGFPIKGVIVTGPTTGVEPDLAYVEEMSKIIRRNGALTVIGSGIKPENIARFWKVSDAFIVGTSVKLGEYTENVVSIERAKALADLVKRYRETWPC